MNLITQDDAKHLAVCYRQYLKAFDEKNHLGICVWGTALLKIQEETGVEMFEPDNLQFFVEHSRKIRKEQGADYES